MAYCVLTYYRCPSRHRRDAVVRECNLPSFRADHLDAAIWVWIKSFLNNPEALEQGLLTVHQQREEQNAPLRERMGVVNDLLADNRAQLERLVDLYLDGKFPIDVLTDRRSRLESTISALEREKTGLTAHLETLVLSAEQIQTVQKFAGKVAGNQNSMDGD